MLNFSLLLPISLVCIWVGGTALAVVCAYFGYEKSVGPYPDFCGCFEEWIPLRDRLVKLASFMRSDDLSENNLRMFSLRLGSVLAWFVGKNYIRAPLDDVIFDELTLRFKKNGCILPEQKLARVLEFNNDGNYTISHSCPKKACKDYIYVLKELPPFIKTRQVMDANHGD